MSYSGAGSCKFYRRKDVIFLPLPELDLWKSPPHTRQGINGVFFLNGVWSAPKIGPAGRARGAANGDRGGSDRAQPRVGEAQTGQSRGPGRAGARGGPDQAQTKVRQALARRSRRSGRLRPGTHGGQTGPIRHTQGPGTER